MGVRQKVQQAKNVFALVVAAIVLLLGLFAGLPAYATTSSSSTVPSLIAQWGSYGSEDGQLMNTHGLALDSADNVYVADTYNNRIQKFDANGNFITKWGSTGSDDGQFEGPYGIAIDTDDNVYVADRSNNRVQKFNADGDFITKWGSHGSGSGKFSAPCDLALDSNNDVYVVDTNSHVQKFDSDGNYITEWGGAGAGNGQLANPSGIAIDASDNVYVLESDNDRVQKLKTDGTYITKWGSEGTSNGQFSNPAGIAIDADGIVYVGEVANFTASGDRIQRFSSNGSFLDVWSDYNGTPYIFENPIGIAVSSKGDVFVAHNSIIQRYGLPQNLASLEAPVTAADIDLALPEGSHITAHKAVVAPTDSDYEYPLGLVDFTFNATSAGATVPIEFTFETDLKPSEVTARKYNPDTETYTDIPDAAITETTINGEPALRLTYDVTDGGELDADGTANGIIVDPVGLATVIPEDDSSSGGGATGSNGNATSASSFGGPNTPNTGLLASNLLPFSLAIAGGLVLLIISQRKRLLQLVNFDKEREQ